eukprot:gene44590-54529_t
MPAKSFVSCKLQWWCIFISVLLFFAKCTRCEEPSLRPSPLPSLRSHLKHHRPHSPPIHAYPSMLNPLQSQKTARSMEEEEAVIMRSLALQVLRLVRVLIKVTSSLTRRGGDTMAGVLSSVVKSLGGSCNVLAEVLKMVAVKMQASEASSDASSSTGSCADASSAADATSVTVSAGDGGVVPVEGASLQCIAKECGAAAAFEGRALDAPSADAQSSAPSSGTSSSSAGLIAANSTVADAEPVVPVVAADAPQCASPG